MNGELIAGLAAVLLTLVTAVLAIPKVRAQARLANSEADSSIAARLSREIQRLDAEMKEVRAELASVKKAAVDEKRELEKRNKLLRDRVAVLEDQIEEQRVEFGAKLEEEREDCAKKLTAMEGHIRQLQQRQASYVNITDKPLSGPLNEAFPPDVSNKDADLVAKLDEIPVAKKGPKRR